VLFDVSNPGYPVYRKTLLSGAGAVRDIVLQNGWAYVAADRLATLDLTATNPTANLTGDPYGSDGAIAVAGGFIFTAEVGYNNDGRINVYEASTPSAPRYLSQQQVNNLYPFSWTSLVPFGTDYLIGISNWKPAGVGHDVTVIDRRDANNLRNVADYDIPNFDGFRGAVIGNMLYVTGVTGGLAIVDLSNPAAPSLLATVPSLGAARGIDTAGATLAIANGSNGVSFVDVTTPSSPRVIGTHALPGSPFAVALSRGAMYVASELGLNSVANVATPPMLNE